MNYEIFKKEGTIVRNGIHLILSSNMEKMMGMQMFCMPCCYMRSFLVSG